MGSKSAKKGASLGQTPGQGRGMKWVRKTVPLLKEKQFPN